MNKKGITLVSIIMIITLLAIVVGGITSYISEGLRFSVSNMNTTKALYMAQAGLVAAIVDFQDNGLWGSVQNNNDAGGEFYYSIGKNADFFWINPATPQTTGKQLKRIPIKNLNSAGSITITDLLVAWTFGGNITSVTLGNSNVWTGALASPASLNITDLAITSGTQHANNNDQIFEFSSNVPSTSSTDMVVTFVFSDGSSRKAYILKSGLGANKEFSITSTGEVRGGVSGTFRRTLLATYDTGTNKITSWQEASSHIIP